MLLTTENFRKLTDLLLLNCYSMRDVGMFNGKSGLAVTLFEVARYLEDEYIEEHAFQTLQTALVEQQGDISVGRGMAGVGCALTYLTEYKFVDASYSELFKEQHDFILRAILQDNFNLKDKGEYIRLLLLLYRVKVPGMQNMQDAAIGKLEAVVGSVDHYVAGSVYPAVGLLYLAIRKFPAEKWRAVTDRILAASVEMWGKDRLCEYPAFVWALWEYGKRIEDKMIIAIGRAYMDILLKNTFPGIASLRQLVDVLLFSEMMGIASALPEKTVCFFAQSTEERLKYSIPNRAADLGLLCGVARLLLTDIYLETRSERIPEMICMTL